MRKLTLAFAVVMITGAFETQSETKKTVTEKVTVEAIISKVDSISLKAEKVKTLRSVTYAR